MSDPQLNLQALQEKWRRNLDELPSTPNNIPAFFFAHGSPMLAFAPDAREAFGHGGIMKWGGPNGPLAAFLKDFGPAVLSKYQPKGVVVFSAHWETHNERLVTDYGDENPLLMDYYGFPPELYQLKFKSRGDTALANRVVELYKEAGQSARLSPKSETHGADGRGHQASGLDHGVFVPFRLMFGDSFTSIPIVQVSIDASLSPAKNWALGNAIARLRSEGILVLAGGLMIHNLRDWDGFSPMTAKNDHKAFDEAIVASVRVKDAEERKKAMVDLTRHHGFRASHPREEHFVPLYIAAGAGEDGEAKVVADIYGCETFAFGL
ncbi:Extradiol ring-cleavage dioxygenase, class III enzyme, subunit B [Mycena sanguinolenta]|nr:Extradiol ring-cleavage dioxygenase, class III enzyme, subunit B [Mycena sanguinolenta]